MASRQPSSTADGIRIPNAMRSTAVAIIAISDAFCRQNLDDEYGELCQRLVGRLARKRPSPLMRGAPEIWAAGVFYTVGSLNFLFDRSQQGRADPQDPRPAMVRARPYAARDARAAPDGMAR